MEFDARMQFDMRHCHPPEVMTCALNFGSAIVVWREYPAGSTEPVNMPKYFDLEDAGGRMSSVVIDGKTHINIGQGSMNVSMHRVFAVVAFLTGVSIASLHTTEGVSAAPKSDPVQRTQGAAKRKAKVVISKPANHRSLYVNHFRLRTGRKELVLDFGVMTTEAGKPRFQTQRRVVLNLYTAKRMRGALNIAIARHERTFGQVKTTEPPKAADVANTNPVHYYNFVRLSSTPEEVIVDCGLNSNPFGVSQKVTITDSFIMLHSTAKRFLNATTDVIRNYEKAHGHIETDVRKRIQRATLK